MPAQHGRARKQHHQGNEQPRAHRSELLGGGVGPALGRSRLGVFLALFEEDISVGALFLRELIDRHEEPADRTHAWLVGVFELMSAGDQGYVSLLVREHQRLSESHPEQMEHAIAPFVGLLVDELSRAMAAGVVRDGDPRRDAQLIFRLTLGAIHDLVSNPADRNPDEMVEYLWSFCWRGLANGGGDA